MAVNDLTLASLVALFLWLYSIYTCFSCGITLMAVHDLKHATRGAPFMAVNDLTIASLVALLLWLHATRVASLMAVNDLKLASLVILLLWLYMISKMLVVWPHLWLQMTAITGHYCDLGLMAVNDLKLATRAASLLAVYDLKLVTAVGHS